ncbi:MAG TPA: phenylphosphate synthase subunit beta [Chloroflexi bacterium]|nr:phenylphosphate synthase subunit beta [Chloroflexota bacterium]
MNETPYVLWFQDCDKSCLAHVGGKNASLGEMTRAGIGVPPGFAVTTAAYRDFLARAGIDREILRIVAGVDGEDLEAAGVASRTIRQLMGSATIPAWIEDAICGAYERLATESGVPNLPVAVRSSATAEDLPDASFAGQQDTTLWVCSAGSVLIRTAICWSSLFTPRAIGYRNKMGFPHEKVLISVGVQKMVNARAAGVMFTLNPANGDRSKIAIDASWGLGEAVVAGMVTPDNFLVDKVTFDIVRRTASPKLVECLPDPTARGVQFRDVPPERQTRLCLSDEEIIALARLAKRIESYYGAPQDIEWAIDADIPFPDNVMTLQSRPETVWSRRPRPTLARPNAGPLDYVLANLLTGVRTRKD